MPDTPTRFPFTVDSLKPLTCPPSGRPTQNGQAWFRDTKVPGLALMVSESGVKTFYWYRKVKGKPTRVRMGTTVEMNVDLARRRAGQLNSQLAEGRDPAAEKQAARKKALSEASLGELWASYRENWLIQKKPNTIKEFDRMYKQHLSAWANRPITSIQMADVERLKIKLGKKSHSAANRTIEVLRAMFRRRGHVFGLPRKFSPTDGVDTYPEHVRDRVLSEEELSKVMTAIDAEENETARDVFRVLIYTGQRKNTVVRMTWQDLNLQGGTWKIPGEKTKNGKPLVLTLIPPAQEILQRRQKDNPPDSPYVFPSRNFTPETLATARSMRKAGKSTRAIAIATGLSQTAVMHVLEPDYQDRPVTPFGGATKIWEHILKRSGIAHATIHDIRRSFCTSLIEHGVPLPIVAAAMGHRSLATTQNHYAFASDKAVAEATATTMAAVMASVSRLQEEAKQEQKISQKG